MTDQQDDLLPYQAPERIGLVMDDFGAPLWALAHIDEADRAVHYTRSDLAAKEAEARVAELEATIDALASAFAKYFAELGSITDAAITEVESIAKGRDSK